GWKIEDIEMREENEEWGIENEEGRMENDERGGMGSENDEWGIENDEWRMENDEWRMEGGEMGGEHEEMGMGERGVENGQRVIVDDEGPTPILLHGVTGSGKTEIYMRAIEYALTRGETAIVLVPEIALAPQTVRRFAARFPGRVAVMHSRLKEGERYDTWRRARLGMYDIVVGPRSAMFLPLKNLGVIVLDEEHDHSYKQNPPVPAPYYHSRDVAIMIGAVTGAIVIMGSATPDIVTYHRAKAGIYQLLELPRRVMGHRGRIESQMARVGRTTAFQSADDDPNDALTIPLPPVTTIDLRNELRAGNRSVFSRILQTEIEATLERKEQVILFLNRRGSSTYVFCRDCGHVLKCPNCDMPFTFYHQQAHLNCHHCGHQKAQPKRCPECSSKRIKYFGLGTEQLEQLVNERWPDARTVRWDRDTTAGRDKHEELLAQFIEHKADILIGTQMIAKGLDLPLVTLVGVISADVSLNLPDFCTGERTFQVLTQVAGRAGRGLLGGRVILQTYEPENYAIKAATNHDFEQFYLAEIRFRTQQSFPPYRRMAKLVYADPILHRGQHAAKEIAGDLRALVKALKLGATEIIGPIQPFFGRIDRRFRWQILIRSTDPTLLLKGYKLPRGWVLDIDPVSTL
ncbi:MAG: replication restart helicase PriA, partial [Candidatus Promineifilaceae bacterium]